jgi:GT2 family glycosyltransferase
MARQKPRKAPPSLVQKLLTRTAEPALAAAMIDVSVGSLSAVSDKGAIATSSAVDEKFQMELDLVTQISDVLIFFGWGHGLPALIDSIKLSGHPENHAARLHRFARPEISHKLGLEETEESLGFLLLIASSKPVATGSLLIEVGDQKKSLPFKVTQALKESATFKTYFNELLMLSEEQGFDDLHTFLSKFAVPNKATALKAAVDYCYLLPNGTLFLSGWAFSEKSAIAAMDVKIGNQKYNLYEKATLIPREDLKQGFSKLGAKAKTAGFISAVKIAGELLERITIKVLATDKEALLLDVPITKLDDLQEFSRIALSYLDISRDGFRELLDNNLGEVLQTGLKEPDKSQFKLKEQVFGEMPKAPNVTIIVPLYGRIDFVKYQLSQFADDADFKNNVELIYVLDDPRHERTFFRYCADHAPLFGVPFKAISYAMNLGYAGANNVAASMAQADHLLLLNSDVLPDSVGWVTTMLDAYKSLKDAGALAPKLLYEDGSIQHAGMAFERLAALDGMWSNMHPGKGMPDTDSVSEQPQVIPAVTGACLMISKVLYDKVGGLDEQYFLGDFEDSDLCLKLIEQGKRNYYLSSLTLYHLERQSQSLFENNDWKTKVTVYNSWQHTKRWDALISKLAGANA